MLSLYQELAWTTRLHSRIANSCYTSSLVLHIYLHICPLQYALLQGGSLELNRRFIATSPTEALIEVRCLRSLEEQEIVNLKAHFPCKYVHNY